MIRVVHLNTFPSGGAGVAARRSHEALQSVDGVHSELIYYANAKKNYFHLARLGWEKLLLRPVIADRDNLFRFSTALTGIDVSKWKTVRDADIIHLHWINNGFLSLHSLEKLFALGKPIAWSTHDMWPFTGGCHHSRHCLNYEKECGNCFYLKNPGDQDISHQVWKKKKALFNTKMTFITPSRWMEEKALNSSLTSGHQVSIIPNTANTTIFKKQDKNAAKKAFGISPEKKVIGFAAANIADKKKGFQHLVKALEILKKQGHNNLEILALGNMKSEVGAGLPYKMNLTGYLSDEHKVAQAYNATDIFVLPSHEESFGLVLLEAMACGVPCVAFKVGGVPDLIDHKTTGYLAQFPDEEDLTAGINYILQGDTELLSANCIEKVKTNFSYESVGRKMVEVYGGMLSRIL